MSSIQVRRKICSKVIPLVASRTPTESLLQQNIMCGQFRQITVFTRFQYVVIGCSVISLQPDPHAPQLGQGHNKDFQKGVHLNV